MYGYIRMKNASCEHIGLIHPTCLNNIFFLGKRALLSSVCSCSLEGGPNIPLCPGKTSGLLSHSAASRSTFLWSWVRVSEKQKEGKDRKCQRKEGKIQTEDRGGEKKHLKTDRIWDGSSEGCDCWSGVGVSKLWNNGQNVSLIWTKAEYLRSNVKWVVRLSCERPFFWKSQPILVCTAAF